MTVPDEHVVDLVGAFMAGELRPAEVQYVREHLGHCLECRRHHDALRDGLERVRRLPVHAAPNGVWDGIVRELDQRAAHADGEGLATRGAAAVAPAADRRVSRWAVRAAAVLVIAVGSGVAAAYALGIQRVSWSVERVAGTPVAGSRPIRDAGELREGEWLETGPTSRARLAIGTLGSADVGPGSRLRLVQAGGAERSLRLERGSLDARVWAPPRFFLVETPTATAFDLGCIYALHIDDRGNGVLRVRSGQVELKGDGRASLVVAGTVAELRSGAGPGTPYAAAEDAAFRDALAVVDFGGDDRSAALERLLSLASARSTITLWHLLPRVSLAERARVYDRLATLSAPPAGIDRGDVMALERRALARWRSALEPSWSNERVRLWKRAWRVLWSVARGE